MMLWFEILGGRVHLSLQDLAGGQFWENKPSLGFHGATSPQVVCQGPACRLRKIKLGRPWWWLGQHSPCLTCQTIFPEEAKHPLFEAWRHVWGARAWWWDDMHWHLDVWGVWGFDHEGIHLDAWHMDLVGPSILLQHQRPPQSGKMSPKEVTSS